MADVAAYNDTPTYAQFMQAANNAAAHNDFDAYTELRNAAEELAQSTKPPPGERGILPQGEAGLTHGLGGLVDMFNSIVAGPIVNPIAQAMGKQPVYPTLGTWWNKQDTQTDTPKLLSSALDAAQAPLTDTRVAKGGPNTIPEALARGGGEGASMLLPMGWLGEGATLGAKALSEGAAATRAASEASAVASKSSIIDDIISKGTQEAAAARSAAEKAAPMVGSAATDAEAAAIKAGVKVNERAAARAEAQSNAVAARQAADDALASGHPNAVQYDRAAALAATNAKRMTTLEQKAQSAAQEAQAAVDAERLSATTLGKTADKLDATVAKRAETLTNAKVAAARAATNVSTNATPEAMAAAEKAATRARVAEAAHAKEVANAAAARQAAIEAQTAPNAADIAAGEAAGDSARGTILSSTVPKSVARKEALAGALRGVGAVATHASRGTGAIATVLSNAEGQGFSELAKQHGAGPGVQFAAGMLGGLDVPILTTLGKGAVKLATSATAKNLAKAAAGEGATAAETVRNGVRNRFSAATESRGPELAATLERNIHDNPLGLHPAELTGDPMTMAMAEHVRGPHADAIAAHAARMDALPAKAAALMPGGGDTALPVGQKLMAQQLEAQVAGHQAEVAAAHLKDQPLLDAISPRVGTMQSSKDAVQMLAQAKQASKLGMSKAWEAVPAGAKAPVTNLQAVGAKIQSALANKTLAGPLPKEVADVLNVAAIPNLKAYGVKQMNTLRSNLLKASRKVSTLADPDNVIRSTMNEAADALHADMMQAADKSGGSAGQSIRNALDVSGAHYEKFGNGSPTEAALKFHGTRLAGKNPAENAITNLVKPTGDNGAIVINQVLDAAAHGGKAQEVGAAIADQLRAQFKAASRATNGTFNPTKAATWLDKNATKFDHPQLQGLKAEFNQAISAKQATSEFARGKAATIKELKTKSAAAQFVSKHPDQVVPAMLNSPVPAEAADQLLALASQDATGTVRKGIREAIRSHIIKAATPSKTSKMSGEALLATMNTEPMPTVLSRFFTKEEIAKWQRLGEQLSTVQQSLPSVSHIMNPSMSPIINSATSILGSKLPIPGAKSSIAAKTAAIRAVKSIIAPNRNPAINEAVHQTFQDPAKTAAALRATAGAASPSMGMMDNVRQGLGSAIGALRAAPAKDVVSMVNPLLSSIMGTTNGAISFQNNQQQ